MDQIRRHNFKTDIKEPLWHIVIEWSIEDLPELFGEMLTHVRIHDQNDDSCVKELSNEGALDDTTLLLTDRILADPGY